MRECDLLIVGGGPAGMSAAVAAYENGVRDILIVERDDRLGGILNQCIHNGFGLHRFGEELTGPEYAWKYEEQVQTLGIPYLLGTMVLDISSDKVVTATNSERGVFQIRAKTIVLAMGCRERPAGALALAGDRPSGIFSAGTAQKYVNVKGYLPGKNVVILGSGDIGLIMARRMTLEGAKVHAVCELMPYSGGLARNIEQCLNDFDIPLLLSHTVVQLHGRERLEGVTIARVDENRRPIEETKRRIDCDTLLLSVGLIPENELSKSAGLELDRVTGGVCVDQDRQTAVEGIFACGNVLHVHDLVDYVSEEAAIAGKAAAEYLSGKQAREGEIPVLAGYGVRYTVPQTVTERKAVQIYFRVSDVYRNARICVSNGEKTIYSKKKMKVAPGEMECISLSPEQFADAARLQVYLEVQ